MKVYDFPTTEKGMIELSTEIFKEEASIDEQRKIMLEAIEKYNNSPAKLFRIAFIMGVCSAVAMMGAERLFVTKQNPAE